MKERDTTADVPADLLAKVTLMVEKSGNPEGFDAVAWLSRWLADPVPALGGARPIDLIGTTEGRELVATTLDQMLSGAYA